MTTLTRIVSFKPFSFAVSCALALNLWGNAALAGDPFRNSNPRDIGDKTEAAFAELFEKGNYKEAQRYLKEAESSEAEDPLLHAMRASLGYVYRDWQTMKLYTSKTLTTAEALKTKDPVRGNLYLAVGNFLEGAYIYKQESPIKAVSKLPLVFEYFDAAENSEPNDPELNLIKGYLDLMLAVNLPFSSQEQAIEKLENYAAPDYLVARGIAVAYRDLKQYDQALEFVDRALGETPDNPELHYLKGQILRKRGNEENNVALLKQAFQYFDKALEKEGQLPESVLKSLRREHEKTQKRIGELRSEQ